MQTFRQEYGVNNLIILSVNNLIILSMTSVAHLKLRIVQYINLKCFYPPTLSFYENNSFQTFHMHC